MTGLAVMPASAGAADGDGDGHKSLRLWLRLLACTNLIESDLRARMRDGFDSTLPRFDMMSQLWRHPDGLKMGELSRLLMVTGGNITGITDQLVAEGLVERAPVPGDRRAYQIRLTTKGRSQFAGLARSHEGWVVAAFAGLRTSDISALHRLLGKVKKQIQNTTKDGP